MILNLLNLSPGKEQISKLANLLPAAIYTVNNEGILTFYNNNAAALWGRHPKINDPNEMRYCGSYKIFTSDHELLERDQSYMAKALKKNKSFRNKEVIIEQPDGSRISAVVNIDPIINDKGEIAGGINVFYDISDKNKAEEKQAILAAIVDSSDDAIASKTLDGEITSWNKGAERIFGYTSEEIIGKNVRTLIPKDRWDEEDYILSKLRKGERIEHYQTIRKRKDGALINVSLTVSPIKNSKGEIIGASKIARDVTEQVQVQQQLKDFNKKLQRLIRYKDDFISLASHELKTPLACASAYTQLLKFENQDSVNATYANKLKQQLALLNDIINDLLELSRLESGKMSYKLESLEINEIVKEAVHLQEQFSSSHKIIIKELGEYEICGDRNRLTQVFNNIISNAIKYSPEADMVDINISKTGNNVEIAIYDYGIGIPKDQMKKIFQKYYRVDDHNSNITGLGIGLFLSKAIIDRHKGKIKAEQPADGKGTIFKITLPLKNSLETCS